MYKNLCIILLLFLCKISNAQNLVPNGDFETYTQLPSTVGQFYLCNGWTNCGGFGTPDYFHLNGTGLAQLPNAFTSTVNPYNGSAVMGFDVYYSQLPDFREYISHPLQSPLVVGNSYQLSFYVTTGAPPIQYGGIGCDHFSIAFSTGPLTQIQDNVINIIPQYTYNGFLYNNSWQHITLNIEADSAYQYITFGSFADDIVQQIQQFDTASVYLAAYYLIDDVNLTSSTGITPSTFPPPIQVYPGIFSESLFVTVNDNNHSEIILYDIAARKVLRETFINSTTLNTEKLGAGMYLYEVRNKYGILKKGKIMKQ